MGVIGDCAMIDYIVIGGTLLYLLYKYSTATFNHWKNMGVPYVKPIPFFGNTIKTISLIQPLEYGLKDLYDKLSPHPYGGIFDLRTPMLIVRDPELLKQIMIKDFNYFQDRGFEYNDKVEPLSANLVNVGGERWKNLRTKLTPAFTSGKLKQMFSLINECSDDLIKFLNNKIEKEGSVHECRSLISKFSTDVIGSCAFGLNFNCMSEETSEFSRIGYSFLAPSYEYALRRLIRFFVPTVADLLKMKDIPEEVTEFFLKLTKDTLEYREKHNVIRKDFMELLRQLKNKGTIYDEPHENETNANWKAPLSPPPEMEMSKEKADVVFDNNLLSAQAFTFFIAGFETTSAALTFCLHEMAINPEVQKKLREEVLEMMEQSNGKLVYETINNMPYLDKVVSETLRKYPTAGHTMRRATKPYVIPNSNAHLNVGDFVVITIYGLHHDPQHYPDPEKFDPERFSKEEIAKRHPYAYMPFGIGPRICIGMRFAILEMKVAMCVILSHFELERCDKTQHPLQLDSRTLFMAVKNGAWLKVSKLKK